MFLPDKKLQFLGICLFLLSLFMSYGVSLSEASSLAQVMVRLDRLNATSPLSGVVCATPSSASAGTEGRVAITFPSDFSLSTTSSNWSTGTSDIPPGSTPWPGISSTAQSVTGTTVTFGSSDLTGTVSYCFTFSSVGSSTGSQGAKEGTVTTRTAGGAVIDTRDYGTTITKDRISVSATVPASPTDFTATLTQPGSITTFSQNDEITYILTYSSELSYATTVTVEASWSLGNIAGSGTPTVDLLDYVIGSASNAHSNAPPVIDMANRKITWTITSFPGNTTKSVSFKLKPNASYQGTSLVNFNVSGRLLGPGTATSYSTVTGSYRFDDGIRPTATPGPTSTPGPQTGPTSTPGPTPTAVPSDNFSFEDILMRTISADTARVEVDLSLPARLQVSYGTSPASLTERLTSLNFSRSHALSFSRLIENTPYYFKVIATDGYGRSVTSDIFTFSTATKATTPKINADTFIATSEKNLIYSFLDRQKTGGKNFIILPPKTLFEIQFAFEENAPVKNVQLIVRDKVLGINTFVQQVEAASFQTPMLEIKPDVYTGRLESKPQPGYYEIFVKVSDYNGNLTEEKLSDLKVSKSFILYREDNEDPVEGARVQLSLLNPRTRLFELISPEMLPIQNPMYSELNGVVPVVLPAGTYRAEITALGYDRKTVTFTIGINPDEDYPSIALKKQPFTPLYGIQYLAFIATDLGVSLDAYVHDIGSSKRVFNFAAFVVTASFAFLALFALSQKTHVRMSHLPRYFFSLMRISFHDEATESAYEGKITDGHSGKPLSGVDIFVSDIDSGKIIFHIKSAASGRFRLILPTRYVYQLRLEKVGYHPASLHLHHVKKDEEQQFAMLENTEALTMHELFRRTIRTVLTITFEVVLLLSIGATLLLSFTIGFLPVLPFLALSFFNLIFWGLHEVHAQAN